MVSQYSLGERVGKFRATKTQLFWSCAACVVATAIVGFSWGGWVTGATARTMAEKASADGQAALAAAVCFNQFSNGADMTAKIASLKGTDTWKRSEFLEKGGWATLPGVEKPIPGSAELCARQLMESELPLTKAGKTSG